MLANGSYIVYNTYIAIKKYEGAEIMGKIKRTYEISTETERGVKLMATLKGMTINEYVDSVLYESLSSDVKKLLNK